MFYRLFPFTYFNGDHLEEKGNMKDEMLREPDKIDGS